MAYRKQSTADILREIERSGAMKGMDPSGRMGLLTRKLGLLTGSAMPDPTPARGLLSKSAPVTGGMANVSPPAPANEGAGLPVPLPARKGLLSMGDRPAQGLLAAVQTPRQPVSAVAAPAPMGQPERRGPNIWAVADDFLFGGAASQRAAERRQRGEAEAMQDAHRQAYAYATQGGQGFNPTAYETRMAELGQAPGYEALNLLESNRDSQDVRGARGRTERRSVTASALAPLVGMDDAQFGQAAPVVESYLRDEGFGLNGPLDRNSLLPMIGVGVGADNVLDNRRADLVYGETVRSNMAGEAQNAAQMAYRERYDQLEREYRANRDMTEDDFRERELALRRELGMIPNSTGDVIAPILSKVATGGVASLNDGERAIWENYQRQSQGGGLADLFGGGGSTPTMGATPAPAAPVASPAPARGGNGGTPQSPAMPQSAAEFDRLPRGAWFINPRDGQLLQKGD